jgi:hypothetical protein
MLGGLDIASRPRSKTSTPQVDWVTVCCDDVNPGDALEYGVVQAKAWGAPVGIEAWCFLIVGRLRPLWHVAGATVLCRRNAAPADPMLVPIVATHTRPIDGRAVIRQSVVGRARRETEPMWRRG